MSEPVSWLVIEPGWRVESDEGKELGTVHEVRSDMDADIFDGLVVSTGLLKRFRYVPAERVDRITQGRVTLSLSADAFERLAEHDQK